MLIPSLLAAAALALPQQAQDTTYERLIREATTDPRFLPASVTTVPSSATLPSPLKYFGTVAGAPGVRPSRNSNIECAPATADFVRRVRDGRSSEWV